MLENHPLLTSSVIGAAGVFYWRHTGTTPPIVRIPLDGNRQFPAAKGIDLFHETPLKITICNNNTHSTDNLEGQTNIVFEVHHSATDALGIVRFVEDILCEYASQHGLIVQREAVDPALLARRSLFGRTWRDILRTLPKQFWGLVRAWKFLMNRVVPLTATMPTDRTSPAEEYPAILHKDLTEAETQNILQRAKQQGITLNDFFLGSAFLAMINWQEQHIADRKKGNLRIAVPTNLRTAVDDRMPAANVVSMVFLDRTLANIQPMPTFYRGVHREMQHIKQCSLGWTFIHGLTVYRHVFGNFRKMTQQDRCWTTATVSNLGRLFTDVPLPIREGRVQIGNSLELIGVETSPPVRASTALGISILTYANQISLTLHYDSNVLTRQDAQSILEDMQI
jgi:NRPS condensation-like uncharacterized protein